MIDPVALRALVVKLESQATMTEPDWRMRSHRCRVCAVRLDGTEGPHGLHCAYRLCGEAAAALAALLDETDNVIAAL